MTSVQPAFNIKRFGAAPDRAGLHHLGNVLGKRSWPFGVRRPRGMVYPCKLRPDDAGYVGVATPTAINALKLVSSLFAASNVAATAIIWVLRFIHPREFARIFSIGE